MWLLEQDARKRMEAAYNRSVTSEQIGAFEANQSPGASHTVGGVAKIHVKGVLTQSRDIFAMLFGGGNTTYSDITEAIRAADNDPAVDSITLEVDSPGGQFAGLFDTLAAMQAAKKPINAEVSGMAASAAYAIASQADTIRATSKASRFGSIGVVATFYTDEGEVSITSTDAPNKRPDVTTEEGKVMVREELDAMHDLFVETIAEGRDVTVKKINETFGRGGTFLADEALKRGMIDSVETAKPKTAVGGQSQEYRSMDLNQLRAQHPSVYEAAVKVGADKERDRIEGHLTMGEASGDTKTAFAAIRDGSEMTASLQAKYMAAGMNRSDVATRQEEDAAASAADGATAPDTADSVLDFVEAKLGIQGGA